jgi:Flp pilus assembly protein TadD
MLKRTLIVLCMTIAIVVAAEPLQTVHGVIMTQAEWQALDSAAAPATNSQSHEGRGNGFFRALTAPFRAIGRLFGKRKKDDNKLERISEKDAKRFESVPGVQVSKTTPAAEVSSSGNATDNSGLANTIANPIVNPIANNGDKNPAAALETIALDHLEKGRALLDNNDLNGAIGELSLAASANPKLSEASTLLGVAYWRKGLRDLAERSFETAVHIEKNDPQNLNNLGFLLYENGDYESATKYLKRAAKLAPNDPRIWNNLGLAQSERGHFDDAYESFARAQGEYKGHLNVAARLERQGSTKKAIKHLEKALALQPNSPDVLARLIDLYDTSGNEKQAQSARSSLETLRTLAKAPVQ